MWLHLDVPQQEWENTSRHAATANHQNTTVKWDIFHHLPHLKEDDRNRTGDYRTARPSATEVHLLKKGPESNRRLPLYNQRISTTELPLLLTS